MTNTDFPALFYYSPEDKIIDTQKTEDFIKRWRGPKQIVRIDGNDNEDYLNHLITGNVVSPNKVSHAVNTILTWHKNLVSQTID